MDRQIPVGNRIVHEKIQQLRIRKHRQTLSMIKSRISSIFNHAIQPPETPKSHRYNSCFSQSKSLQIQRQNIKLFSKISSIINQKPKLIQSISYTPTFKQANAKLKKKQERIKTENQILQKRLSQQKPTIQIKQLYKDRMKNLKYLKMLGKFPYMKAKKRQSHSNGSNSNLPTFKTKSQDLILGNEELYRKKIDHFLVKIARIPNKDYQFSVQAKDSKKVFQITMNKDLYQDQFKKCGYNYNKMISRFRLNEYQQVEFQQIKGNETDITIKSSRQ